MKFALLVHAGPQELARAVHGLLYAQDLHNAGHEVQVIFDGAGTTWVKAFEAPDHKYHDLYLNVKKLGVLSAACEYCAQAFGVLEEVQQAGIPLTAGGHPSLAELVAKGFSPFTL